MRVFALWTALSARGSELGEDRLGDDCGLGDWLGRRTVPFGGWGNEPMLIVRFCNGLGDEVRGVCAVRPMAGLLLVERKPTVLSVGREEGVAARDVGVGRRLAADPRRESSETGVSGSRALPTGRGGKGMFGGASTGRPWKVCCCCCGVTTADVLLPPGEAEGDCIMMHFQRSQNGLMRMRVNDA